MNDYQMFLKIRTDRADVERELYNAYLVREAMGNEKAQPRGLRFHLRLHLPHFGGFHFRRQPQNCVPLNAR